MRGRDDPAQPQQPGAALYVVLGTHTKAGRGTRASTGTEAKTQAEARANRAQGDQIGVTTMSQTFTTIRGHTVLRDDDTPQRWYDVWGPNCVAWKLDLMVLPQDASANPAGYTATEVGTNTAALQDSTDQATLLFTTGGTENNGIQIQPLGEAFSFANRYPAYFSCEFQINDVDQTDVFVGLAIQDTTVLAGCSDDIGFRTDDGSAALLFVLEKDSVETTNSVATLSDATWIAVDFYYDGQDYVYAYVDDVLKATVAVSDTNMPDNEHLTPTIAILTGETAAQTLTIRRASAFQIYE